MFGRSGEELEGLTKERPFKPRRDINDGNAAKRGDQCEFAQRYRGPCLFHFIEGGLRELPDSLFEAVKALFPHVDRLFVTSFLARQSSLVPAAYTELQQLVCSGPISTFSGMRASLWETLYSRKCRSPSHESPDHQKHSRQAPCSQQPTVRIRILMRPVPARFQPVPAWVSGGMSIDIDDL